MAFSYDNYTGNGTTTQFSITFTYQDTSEISVTVDGVAETGLTFPSSSTVQLTSAPAIGTLVQVKRTTDLTSRAVDFASGSVLTEEDLDDSSIQVFHAAQEAIDRANQAIALDTDDKWDAQNKVIKNVADPVNNNDAVNKQFISTNLPNINTVAGIAADVTTVANNTANIAAVVSDAADIGTVATNIASVNTVATNIADVITVASDLNEAISEIETAADDLNEAVSDIDTVSTNIANVNAVGGNIANVNTVAGISGNVTTVAGISGNVTTVAGASTNISTVASNISSVNTVAGISANVTAVAADATDIGTVASNITNVNNVAANSANITSVAGNATNINSVASNATNINTVAGDISSVGTVAVAITNVNNVGSNIANVNTVASNLTDINAFADTYFISATAPASPTTGDLWFDTTNDIMKVYDGSGFVNAGSSVNGTSERQTYTATGGQTTFAATYDAGYVDVYLNGVKLINGSDFTATSGSSIVLSTGATAGDTVDIVAYGTFDLLNLNISNDTTPQLGGNLDLNSNDITGTGNINVTGTVTTDGLTVDGGGNINFLGGTNDAQYIKFGDTNDADIGNIFYYHGNNNMVFTANASEAMRIKDGHLLVGTVTNTGTIGTYDGFGALSNGSVFSSATSTRSIFARRSTDGDILEFRKDGTKVGSIGAWSSSLLIGTGDVGLAFVDGTPERIQPRKADDQLSADGLIDLGHTSNRFKDLYLSGGVYLGGTGSANYLDDYEEGTWTPVPTSTGATFSTSAAGKYTKVGNLVFISMYLDNSSAPTGTLTNTMSIYGLPFANNSGGFGCVLTVGFLNFVDAPASKYQIAARIGNGASYMTPEWFQDDSGVTNMTAQDFDYSDARLVITGHYYTDS